MEIAANIAAQVILVRRGGPLSITRRGLLRLPAGIQHACELEPGARLFVVALPDNDLVLIYTNRAVEAMLLAYSATLTDTAAPHGR
ncbi:hypothetical protein AB0M43_35765 [Longispora sp. NPDC051575]|uniref:hypothetical protein n=1 Tax=Longispora sp. NPDC051575 TaxID=3154943 RepID=UPI0034359D50